MQLPTLNQDMINKSTKVSSASILVIAAYNLDFTFFENQNCSRGFKNCDEVLNTVYYLSNTKLIFENNELIFNLTNNNEFMDYEHIMTGVKRSLQSKSCERKRRWSTATFADSSERNEIVSATPRVRQTRQTAQLTNISKNKSNVQAHMTSSRKLLRSSKQDFAEDGEEIQDYGVLEKQSRQTEFKIAPSDRDTTDMQQNENKMFNTNIKLDSKIKNFECNKDKILDDKAFSTQEGAADENGTEEEEEEEREVCEVQVEKKKLEEINESLNSFSNKTNSSDCSMLKEAPLPSYPALNRNEIFQPEPSELHYALERKGQDNVELNSDPRIDQDPKKVILKFHSNENSNINSEIEKENKNQTQLMQQNILEVTKLDIQHNKCKVLQTSCKEILAVSRKPFVTRTESSPSKQLQFGGLDYENELFSNSSSLSSDTSTTSSSRTNNQKHENFPNSCESRLKICNETQPKKSEFLKKMQTSTSPSVVNSQQLSSTNYDRAWCKTEQQEQFNRFKTDKNNGCTLKSHSCSTPPLAKIISSITAAEQSSNNHSIDTIKLNTDFHCAILEKPVSPLSKVAPHELYTSDRKDVPQINPNPSTNTCDIQQSDQFVNEHFKITKRLDCTIEPKIKHPQISNVFTKKQDLEENVKILHQKNEEEQDFDKYLSNSRMQQHTEFDIERNDASHQQHEKDIIDAADKVYTQIEEQQQQYHQHVTSSYEHMINNHNRNQQQQHHQDDEHQQNHNVERQQLQHIALIQSQHHSMQQHYASDQLYQLQQEQQQLHLKQQFLLHQNQQHHILSRNQTPEQRQLTRSHMMDFLHPQHHNTANTHSPLQPQQVHEVYHDLMMDEFHDNHNTSYKLGLSPSNEKHENQDDGYETSAGDVLTPNSHASSTPHHVQHSAGALLSNAVKCEDQQQQRHTQLQQQPHFNLHLMTKDQNLQHELRTNDSTANIPTGEPYHFTDDDLHTGKTYLRNILTPPHPHRIGSEETGPNNFMVMQTDRSTANMNASNDLFGTSNSDASHQVHQQTCIDLNSSTQLTQSDHHQEHFSSTGHTNMVGNDKFSMLDLQDKPTQKRRGRKKKMQEGIPLTLKGLIPNDNIGNGVVKTKDRKKHDRFNGMSEEDVVKRILPDHLCDNLDIVIIGINPGLFAAYKGHHYAGPGNHFWKCLYLSGLTPEQMNSDDDFKLIEFGIGFTNMVQRATKGSADLTRKEIKEGSRILSEKLQRFRPKIAVFNGKLIFEVFSGKKDFNFGRQPECVEGTDTYIWVMPSSSARCAQLPRAADKVPFYAALKKFRDYLNGLIPHIDEAECVFTEERIKQHSEQENFKNHQSATNATGSYTNIIGITNTDNSLENGLGCSFGSETNPHGTVGGPGPPRTGLNESFIISPVVTGQQEKKKRGRPKKIKGQEIIDPITGNKIIVNNHLHSESEAIDYTNILNLSVIQGNNSEIPKKKRGRPKKTKPQPTQLDMFNTQSSLMTQKTNIMSIQSMTGDLNLGSAQRQGLQTKHLPVGLYSTPPHQMNIYSPMVSPTLNCSYAATTPPCQPHHVVTREHGQEAIKTSLTNVVTSHHHQIPDQNLPQSSPSTSPNICAVDFEPPTAASVASLSNVNEQEDSELTALHQRLQNSHERSRYNSPINPEVSTDHNTSEHFQQWLSPQHNHTNSPALTSTTAVFDSPQQHQQSSLHYHDQQHQMQILHPQELLAQWPLRHQSRYENTTSRPYLINSSQLSDIHPHSHHYNNQLQHTGSDVARKSIYGLESLVDQIPTISESESVALSSVAAVNAQVAAAAAVATRLQGMQNILTDTQVPDSHYVNSTTPSHLTATTRTITTVNNSNQQLSSSNNLLNNNFSVSNLAASSATSNINNNHESYGQPVNARPTNTNAYHHSNLMAVAALAAAAANSTTNLSTSTAVSTTATHHAQMYIDPHAHLTTHVPVNAIYPSTSHHHPATAAHHVAAAHHHHAAAAAAHYGNTQHTAADYARNPYAAAAAAQNNVNAVHTLHMPSPNYPYGYATTSNQSSYSGYPHSHAAHHGHPHHLAIFDRLKHSDIGGYSGF